MPATCHGRPADALVIYRHPNVRRTSGIDRTERTHVLRRVGPRKLRSSRPTVCGLSGRKSPIVKRTLCRQIPGQDLPKNGPESRFPFGCAVRFRYFSNGPQRPLADKSLVLMPLDYREVNGLTGGTNGNFIAIYAALPEIKFYYSPWPNNRVSFPFIFGLRALG